jgi:hypothetical protein
VLWVTICNNACTCLYSKIEQKWENVQASVLELAVALNNCTNTVQKWLIDTSASTAA